MRAARSWSRGGRSSAIARPRPCCRVARAPRVPTGAVQPGTGGAAGCRAVAGRGDRGADRKGSAVRASRRTLEQHPRAPVRRAPPCRRRWRNCRRAFRRCTWRRCAPANAAARFARRCVRYVAYQQQIDVLRKKLVSASIYPLVLCGGGHAGDAVPAGLRGAAIQRHLRGHGRRSAVGLAAADADGAAARASTACAVLLAVLGIVGARALRRCRARRHAPALGAALARIPAIGRQLHTYQLARLYRTVGMLLRGGMPAVTALQMSEGLLVNVCAAPGARAGEPVRPRRPVGGQRHGALRADHAGCRAHAASRRAQRQHGRDDGAHRRVLRRRAGARRRYPDAPDRAAADEP